MPIMRIANGTAADVWINHSSSLLPLLLVFVWGIITEVWGWEPAKEDDVGLIIKVSNKPVVVAKMVVVVMVDVDKTVWCIDEDESIASEGEIVKDVLGNRVNVVERVRAEHWLLTKMFSVMHEQFKGLCQRSIVNPSNCSKSGQLI